MSDMFPIKNGLKQGDALSPFLFTFALEYAMRRVHINQDGVKLNGTHQLWFMLMMLICWTEVYIHTIKKNTEASVVASKETGLDGNADKTKYMVMSRDQNSRRSRSIMIDNSSFERVKQPKYFGITLLNQNSIQEEIRSRLKSGNACYNSVQNLLPSSLLSKNIKININRTIILPVVLYGCETWLFTLREHHNV